MKEVKIMNKFFKVLLIIIFIIGLVLLVGYYIIMPLKATKIVKDSENWVEENILKISMEEYIKGIENAILISKLNNIEVKPDTYKYDGSDLEINIDIKGYKPDAGTFTLDENGNVSKAIFCIENSTLTYSLDDGVKYLSNNCNDLK